MATGRCAECTSEGQEEDKLQRCTACKTVLYCSPTCQKANWKIHKPACKSVTTSKPFFVHIDFDRQTTDNVPWVKPFIDSISLPFSSTYFLATKASSALAVLSHPIRPRSILVSTGEIADAKNAPLRAQLRSYITSGGTVLLGGPITNHINMDRFEPLFADLGAPEWKRDAYHRTSCYLNVAHPLFAALPSHSVIRGALPSSYSAKSVHLMGVPADQAVYQSDSRSQLEGLIPGLRGNDVKEAECSVAAKRVGEGIFAYVGDVNQESGSTMVSLWLLGVKE